MERSSMEGQETIIWLERNRSHFVAMADIIWADPEM
jgi:hypothetical protein